MKLALVFFSFTIVHVLVWFTTNLQLIKGFDEKKAFFFCILLAVPCSLSAYWATKVSFEYFDSAWSARLIGHGTSYLIFPILTWVLLNESPFNTKTGLCILLSLLIVWIQVFYPK